MEALNIKEEFGVIANEYNTLLEKINKGTTEYSQQLSEYDLEVSDILHFIEFEKFNAVKACKVLKILKDVLNNRRDTKNNLHYYQFFGSRLNQDKIDMKKDLKDYKLPSNYTYKTDVLSMFDRVKDFKYGSSEEVKQDSEIPEGYVTIKEATQKLNSEYKCKINIIPCHVRSWIKSSYIDWKMINKTYYLSYQGLVDYLDRNSFLGEMK